MTTEYVEPVRGVGAPGPFRSVADQQFMCLTDGMSPLFEKGYAITDLQGLERMGQVLYHLLNHRSSDVAANLSSVVALKKLAEIVQILTTFRPMRREESLLHMEIAQRLNFGRCYKFFFNYIEQMSFRLTDMVNKSEVNAGRCHLLLHIQRIIFYVSFLKGCVSDKFDEYPHPDFLGFQWDILTDYSDCEYLPPAVHAIFLEYPKPIGPLPPWLFPQNTTLIRKVVNSRKFKLMTLAVSDEGFVCICKKRPTSIDSLSFFQDCDHLFCSVCLKDWLLNNGYDQW